MKRFSFLLAFVTFMLGASIAWGEPVIYATPIGVEVHNNGAWQWSNCTYAPFQGWSSTGGGTIWNDDLYDGGDYINCVVTNSLPREDIEAVDTCMSVGNLEPGSGLARASWRWYDQDQDTWRMSVDYPYTVNRGSSKDYRAYEWQSIDADDYTDCWDYIMKLYFKFESDESNSIFYFRYPGDSNCIEVE